MIPRYTRDKISSIWSQEHKYNIWLKIEHCAIIAMEKHGIVNQGFAEYFANNADFDIENINILESELHHDVLAFLTDVSSRLDHQDARMIHYGMTSSDVLDTTLSIQAFQANKIILNELMNLSDAIYHLALKHKYTKCMGRSHGIHAEVTTFGVKMLHHASIFERYIKMLYYAMHDANICKISGAIGNYAHITPDIELHVAELLGMQTDAVSTQIVSRDRYANLFSLYALIASGLENLAIEIRHLQRTEVAEAFEAFGKMQKGSSAMPHKRNPVLTENITGIARVIRSAVIPALENIVSWHERDISHSSVERLNFPTTTALLDFSLHRMTNVITNLVIDSDKMMQNISILGQGLFSQKIMLYVLSKESTISRDEIYRFIQRNITMEKDEFIQKICATFSNIIPQEIEQCLVYDSYIKNTDFIFEKFAKLKNQRPLKDF